MRPLTLQAATVPFAENEALKGLPTVALNVLSVVVITGCFFAGVVRDAMALAARPGLTTMALMMPDAVIGLL